MFWTQKPEFGLAVQNFEAHFLPPKSHTIYYQSLTVLTATVTATCTVLESPMSDSSTKDGWPLTSTYNRPLSKSVIRRELDFLYLALKVMSLEKTVTITTLRYIRLPTNLTQNTDAVIPTRSALMLKIAPLPHPAVDISLNLYCSFFFF